MVILFLKITDNFFLKFQTFHQFRNFSLQDEEIFGAAGMQIIFICISYAFNFATEQADQ
jgi:hypothetical protein